MDTSRPNPVSDFVFAWTGGSLPWSGPHVLFWACVTASLGLVITWLFCDEEQELATGAFVSFLAGALWPFTWVLVLLGSALGTAFAFFALSGKAAAALKRRLHD